MNVFRALLARLRAPAVPHIPPLPGIKGCCLDPRNRILVAVGVATSSTGEKSPTETRQCRVCGCNHHRLFAGKRLEPGKVKLN